MEIKPRIYESHLQAVRDNLITLKINDYEAFKNELKRGNIAFDVIPHEPYQLSDVQRRKAYAMIHDIADYEGYPDDIKKITLKEQFKAITGYSDFSLSNCKKDVATAFIAFLVEYCFKFDIPFRFKDLTNTFDTERQVYLCLVHKRCTVCGAEENIEINHEDTVGQGMNRNHIDHRGHRLEALCHFHHFEFHQIGAENFAKKYHFHGIRLKSEDIVSLKLMSWKQIHEFDEEYRRQKTC
ncbi:putative HNHc nuclease [Liquorilactobacillus vini]|uniref:putative HNHc nuclease n=1 Tax=Liquorilactobacillus vini TaxID=238015 RepID=UPI000313FA19|nr:putative HNHc nuclease [Liquorilactobacillus vini]